MRLCLVGEYSANPDEGMKNVAFYLTRELSRRHEVINLSPKAAFSLGFWRKAKSFRPQIIHYIPGPSLFSFILAKALSSYCGEARVVMSAFHPSISPLSMRLIPLLKPDLVLIQSSKTEKMLSDLGCPTVLLPCGVDLQKFAPVSREVKGQFRQKYGVEREKFVVLHVGAVNRGRNVGVLEKLQGGDNQVIIVGSSSVRAEGKLQQHLEQRGCLVWKSYLSQIEEIYGLSDCYIFPTSSTANSIELPLSVMEAMASNLPLISTRFGALPRFFDEGGGVIFVDQESEFADSLEQVKGGALEVKTREKVLPYSWENVTQKLEEVYSQLAD